MRILTFSTLFPNAAQPRHGIFVENRLRHLVASGAVEARVLAPVPWFPFAGDRFGTYAAYARAPRAAERHGIAITHPRYAVLPKIGANLAPLSLFRASLGPARRMIAEGFDFDLIDSHFFFPDGIAAVLLGRALGKPVTVTARGTDLNLMPQWALPRAMIRWAAARADGMITVAAALKDVLVDLGVPADRVSVLRNGVELELFRPPADRPDLRRRLGIAGPTLLTVGHLIERKGHHLAIEALLALPSVTLLVVGDGPEEGALRTLADRLGVADRVRFLGALPHAELPDYYGAADALVLASSREGWANVLLESMACGTPVVATRVWGTPEVVTMPAAGRLAERTAPALAAAAADLLASPPQRTATRMHAERFGWDATTRGQIDLFRTILDRRGTAFMSLPRVAGRQAAGSKP